MYKKYLTKLLVPILLFTLVTLVGCSVSVDLEQNEAENQASDESIETTETKEFTIQAIRFGYSPDTISVTKGDKVRLNIDNTDVPHGIRIPELNLQGENSLEFTANQVGQFDWYCLVPCGSGHMQMKGKLIVK